MATRPAIDLKKLVGQVDSVYLVKCKWPVKLPPKDDGLDTHLSTDAINIKNHVECYTWHNGLIDALRGRE